MSRPRPAGLPRLPRGRGRRLRRALPLSLVVQAVAAAVLLAWSVRSAAGPPASSPGAAPVGLVAASAADASPPGPADPEAAPGGPDAGGPSGAALASSPNGVVVRVIDGDTVEVDLGGRREHVRLIGIDTPETVDPDRPAGCYGHEASALTASLLPPGTPGLVSRDAEARDRYGRLLVYLERAGDGLSVNLELVARGAAVPLRIEPNTAYAADIEALAAQARASRAGLWGACGGPGLPASATTTTTTAAAGGAAATGGARARDTGR